MGSAVTRRLATCSAAFAVLSGPAGAQQGPIVLDGSLGPAGDVPFDTDPQGDRTYQITDDLGEFSGDRNNLFHSFSRFDVPAGDTALFSSSELPDRVIARVTGDDVSDIDGTLRSSISGADLFLINPLGVLFGPDAVVDVRGSFYASSADQLRFEGTAEPVFSSRDASPAPLLSSAEPRAFGFLVEDPASIALDGSQLSVPEGETLMLAGGDIDVQGRAGIQVPSLGAAGGELVLASAGSAGEIPLAATGLDALMAAPGALGEIRLSRAAVLDVSSRFGGASGSGRVVIRGGRVVFDGASVNAQAQNGLAGDATAVDIAASESVVLDGASSIQSFATQNGEAGDVSLAAPLVELSGASVIASFAASGVAGPDIRVSGGALVLGGGAQVSTTSFTAAPGGAIELSGGGQVSLDNGAQVVSLASAGGTGGRIDVAANELNVMGSSQITSENRGAGGGGAIDLAVGGALRILEGGQVSTRAAQTATGEGGALQVAAGTLAIETGAAADVSQLSALTFSTLGADGGSLTVAASSVALLDGGQIRTTSTLPDGSPGGSPLATGDAGDLEIDLSEGLLAQGLSDAGIPSGVFSRSAASSTGRGGDLSIDARSLELLDGAEVSARTVGAGDAGGLAIRIAERLRVVGGESGASTISARGDTGRGGDLQIDADVVELRQGGVVSASTLGTGDSGDLVVNAREVRISGETAIAESGLFAQTLSGRSDAGNAGDLRVVATELLAIADGGRLSVASLGGGLAGDVDIRGGGSVEVAAGEISARVVDTRDISGSGASDIRIADASAVLLSNGALVTAETRGTGAGGLVEIRAGQVELSGGSEVTARSTGLGSDSGDAGSISIASDRHLTSTDSSLTTTATNAGGGQIDLFAARNVELVRSRVETTVSGMDASADAGNIDIPLRNPLMPDAPIPAAVVLSAATVRANAVAADAGNITISADLVLSSANSVVEATSELGVDGIVDVPGPNRELVGQLAVLPANYVDVASLLTTPCDARTNREGSFVIHRREPVDLRDDLPLGLDLLGDPAGRPSEPAPQCDPMENAL
jgi:filamentous hemagglutinin family protein